MGAEEDGVSESTFPYASLGNAAFTVKYFPDIEYSTLKEIENSGKKPKCTWTFVTKDYGDAGSDTFQKRGDRVNDIYNTSGGVEIAGIEFNPLDRNVPRDEAYRKMLEVFFSSWTDNDIMKNRGLSSSFFCQILIQ